VRTPRRYRKPLVSSVCCESLAMRVRGPDRFPRQWHISRIERLAGYRARAQARIPAALAQAEGRGDGAVLLGPKQLARTAAAYKVPPAQRVRLSAIAHELLALGISIDGLAERAEFNDSGLTEVDAAEALIAATRPATIDIHLSGPA
jgi:hypothetical protein